VKSPGLDPKRRRFVEEYRVDWNATQAAIRAGYSPRSARQHASYLLTKHDIQEALAEVMAEDGERCHLGRDQGRLQRQDGRGAGVSS